MAETSIAVKLPDDVKGGDWLVMQHPEKGRGKGTVFSMDRSWTPGGDVRLLGYLPVHRVESAEEIAAKTGAPVRVAERIRPIRYVVPALTAKEVTERLLAGQSVPRTPAEINALVLA